MEANFWQQRWASNQIGFHEAEHHPQLRAHWPTLGVTGGQVLVPLCGKSLDMVWLRERGHEVLGVELSDIAVRAFFAERGLTPTVMRRDGYEVFAADGYTLLCGDFFALTTAALGVFAAIYDRAALIALPPDMRRAYAATLTRLAAPGTPMLTITVEYDTSVLTPPPFTVMGAEVQSLYADAWQIEDRGRVAAQVKGQPGIEGVYVLQRA
ncbi:MAG: thiopurine S-methyltransferase [Gammaproteobacteria bacterium]